jgi:hypothetical protein
LCKCDATTKISVESHRAVAHEVSSWRRRKCTVCEVVVHRDLNAVRAEACGCAIWQCRSGAVDKSM